MNQENKQPVQAGDETSASFERRTREGFYTKYIQGKGLDVGPGHKPIAPDADTWDKAQGDPDATYLAGVKDNTYDYLYSSHVLEHVDEPLTALEHWWRVLKQGGYLIVVVPDEDLYEQGIWPSQWNPDHRNTFTAYKNISWSPKSINLVELVSKLEGVKLISARIIDEGYDYKRVGQDQKGAERGVEIIAQKQPAQFEWRRNLIEGFQCFCGSKELTFKGVYSFGDVLFYCRSCKTFAKVSVLNLLTQIGYKIDRPRTAPSTEPKRS